MATEERNKTDKYVRADPVYDVIFRVPGSVDESSIPGRP